MGDPKFTFSYYNNQGLTPNFLDNPEIISEYLM